MKTLILLGLLLTRASFAQELPDVQSLFTDLSFGSPFTLPVTINQRGELSLLGGSSAHFFTSQPTLQVGYSSLDMGYSRPVRYNRFNFYPRQDGLGWVEVQFRRMEVGVGPAISSGPFSLGLAVYRGALFTTIHHKPSQAAPTLPLVIPKTLPDLRAWAVQDSGSFQTSGGISAFVSVSAGLIDFASIAVDFQNQFTVDLRKLSPHKISLTISEDDLFRRQVSAGPFFASAAFAAFRGNRFSVQFEFDLRNPAHHRYYEEALNGNVQLVQEAMRSDARNVTWVGSDQLFYVGIPYVISRIVDSGTVDIRENGQQATVDYSNSRTRGMLANHRFHQDFVYHTENSLVLIWASEMTGARGEDVERRFLGRARALKIQGFDRTLERRAPFGTVITQLAIQLRKPELEQLEERNLGTVIEHLRERCETEWLPCDAEPQLRRIVEEYRTELSKPWAQKRGGLGRLFLKHPALLSAVLSTLGLRKQAYFKFLSEKYQSIEGMAGLSR